MTCGMWIVLGVLVAVVVLAMALDVEIDAEKHMSHEDAGNPYRPSNGTEGEIFESDFCERCKHDRGCRIPLAAMCYRETEPEYPKEWIYDGRGRGTCTAFESIENGNGIA